jgi:hypothetical protein
MSDLLFGNGYGECEDVVVWRYGTGAKFVVCFHHFAPQAPVVVLRAVGLSDIAFRHVVELNLDKVGLAVILTPARERRAEAVNGNLGLAEFRGPFQAVLDEPQDRARVV